MIKTFKEAMDFRHACKLFDESRKISDEEIREILEAGRKSPSSFGMEPWKFLVITNEELKAKIRPFCDNYIVNQLDSDNFPRLDKTFSYDQILLRRKKIIRRVIVSDNYLRSQKFNNGLKHFTRMNQARIYRAN